MVTVTYRPDKHELKMKGHAMQGDVGKDPVCAAISMCFYNICAMLRQYPPEAFLHPPDMAAGDKKGVSFIKCTPAAGYETWIDHDFLYALVGFEQLQGNFPDAINVKVMQH